MHLADEFDDHAAVFFPRNGRLCQLRHAFLHFPQKSMQTFVSQNCIFSFFGFTNGNQSDMIYGTKFEYFRR